MDKCAARYENVECLLESGHEKIVKVAPDGSTYGIMHKANLSDGRTVKWCSLEHCLVHGHVFGSNGHCVTCRWHRDPA